ncbi:MAG: DNA primase [Saprospiraceae bacterium]|jgi:DNA primase
MIPKETIDKILDEARIEEVVGDFVSLKKKGANLLGNCPFHNEKTPSFTVSPVKGIYKCFGCGEAGNSVNFLMQHESISYPESLRQLAKKYNIEIVEDALTEEQKQKQDKREKMFLLTQFASDHYAKNLLESEEGKLIGYSYFKERGISDEMIERFSLGYSFEQRDGFTKQAIEKGYGESILKDCGLCIQKEGRKAIDRFYGRVIFPIQNLSGRVLGFGARTLKTEKKIAKYLNSPETEIYHKSKVLYGLYQSKRRISQDNNCFLVEGYTDVISLHQKGIDNVVSSSGTSLTEDQIKLIKRFTPNITILFDGDAAGIKASFRGIDMLLKQDMNVKVVLFPEGEDPDSFARNNSTFDLENFLKDNAQDFIQFKCSVLMEDLGNDPFKKAELIKNIVESVSLISDNITRSVYVKEAALLLEIEEQTLLNELLSIRGARSSSESRFVANKNSEIPDFPSPLVSNNFQSQEEQEQKDSKLAVRKKYVSEREVIRILLLWGHMTLVFPSSDEEDSDEDSRKEVDSDTEQETKEESVQEIELSVAEYIIRDLEEDELSMNDPVYQEIYATFKERLSQDEIPTEMYFMKNENPEVVKMVIEIGEEKYELSENWKKHLIYVALEVDQLKLAISVACNRLKLEQTTQLIDDIQERIKNTSQDSTIDIDVEMLNISKLLAIKKVISEALGRT